MGNGFSIWSLDGNRISLKLCFKTVRRKKWCCFFWFGFNLDSFDKSFRFFIRICFDLLNSFSFLLLALLQPVKKPSQHNGRANALWSRVHGFESCWALYHFSVLPILHNLNFLHLLPKGGASLFMAKANNLFAVLPQAKEANYGLNGLNFEHEFLACFEDSSKSQAWNSLANNPRLGWQLNGLRGCCVTEILSGI